MHKIIGSPDVQRPKLSIEMPDRSRWYKNISVQRCDLEVHFVGGKNPARQTIDGRPSDAKEGDIQFVQTTTFKLENGRDKVNLDMGPRCHLESVMLVNASGDPVLVGYEMLSGPGVPDGPPRLQITIPPDIAKTGAVTLTIQSYVKPHDNHEGVGIYATPSHDGDPKKTTISCCGESYDGQNIIPMLDHSGTPINNLTTTLRVDPDLYKDVMANGDPDPAQETVDENGVKTVVYRLQKPDGSSIPLAPYTLSITAGNFKRTQSEVEVDDQRVQVEVLTTEEYPVEHLDLIHQNAAKILRHLAGLGYVYPCKTLSFICITNFDCSGLEGLTKIILKPNFPHPKVALNRNRLYLPAVIWHEAGHHMFGTGNIGVQELGRDTWVKEWMVMMAIEYLMSADLELLDSYIASNLQDVWSRVIPESRNPSKVATLDPALIRNKNEEYLVLHLYRLLTPVGRMITEGRFDRDQFKTFVQAFNRDYAGTTVSTTQFLDAIDQALPGFKADLMPWLTQKGFPHVYMTVTQTENRLEINFNQRNVSNDPRFGEAYSLYIPIVLPDNDLNALALPTDVEIKSIDGSCLVCHITGADQTFIFDGVAPNTLVLPNHRRLAPVILEVGNGSVSSDEYLLQVVTVSDDCLQVSWAMEELFIMAVRSKLSAGEGSESIQENLAAAGMILIDRVGGAEIDQYVGSKALTMPSLEFLAYRLTGTTRDEIVSATQAVAAVLSANISYGSYLGRASESDWLSANDQLGIGANEFLATLLRLCSKSEFEQVQVDLMEQNISMEVNVAILVRVVSEAEVGADAIKAIDTVFGQYSALKTVYPELLGQVAGVSTQWEVIRHIYETYVDPLSYPQTQAFFGAFRGANALAETPDGYAFMAEAVKACYLSAGLLAGWLMDGFGGFSELSDDQKPGMQAVLVNLQRDISGQSTTTADEAKNKAMVLDRLGQLLGLSE